MITAFDIYLFGLLCDLGSSLKPLIVAGVSISIVLSVILFIMKIDPHPYVPEEVVTKTAKILKVSLVSLAVIVAMAIFAPSKETVIAMATIPPVVNNEKVQELPENVLDFVNGWLKEYTPKKAKELAKEY